MRKRVPAEVKPFVEYKLEHIHQIEQEMNAYISSLMPSSTPSYSGMPGGGGGESRPSEELSIKLATDPYLREAEKTVRVFHNVLDNLNETDLKLIDLVYWKKTHNKEGAALACNMSKTAAYNKINNILFKLALDMGYVNL